MLRAKSQLKRGPDFCLNASCARDSLKSRSPTRSAKSTPARRSRMSAASLVSVGRRSTRGRRSTPHLGVSVSELRRLRQLEDENARLKRLVADLTLDKHMLS